MPTFPQQTANPQLARHLSSLAGLAFESTFKVLHEEYEEGRFAKLARRMERLADKQVAQAEAASPIRPACAAGCYYCCAQQVVATVPEILAVASYIKENWTAEQIDALKIRIAEYKEMAVPYVLSESDVPPNTACPLLKDGLCSVWEARPLVCRGYNSLDANLCREQSKDWSIRLKIPHFPEQRHVTDAFQDGLMGAVRRRGTYPDGCDLILGLEIALTVPDAERRFAQGEPVFADAACREARLPAV